MQSQQNADIKMFNVHTMFTSRKTIIHISLCDVYNVDASVWFAVLLYDYFQKRMFCTFVLIIQEFCVNENVFD